MSNDSRRNPWATPGEVASVLRLDTSTVRKACRARALVTFRPPGSGRGRKPRWLILTRPSGLPYKPTDPDLPEDLPPEARPSSPAP